MDRSAGWFIYYVISMTLPKFQCFIHMYRFFILAFGLFYAKVLCPVFFQRVLSQMCYCVFVFMHTQHTLLSLCSNSHRNTLNNVQKTKTYVYWLNMWQFEPIWARGEGLSANNRFWLAQRDEMHWFLLTNQCCLNVM